MTDAPKALNGQLTAALEELGLPASWAGWIEAMSVDVDRQRSSPHTIFRPEPPERTIIVYEDDDEMRLHDRTNAEMALATAQYELDLEHWRRKYGDAAMVEVCVALGDQTTVRVAGGGRSMELMRYGDDVWRVMEVSP